jgi:hypothetical protein
MNTLQIQDAFQPYYAGREESREDHAVPAKKTKETSLSQQKRAARRIKDAFQARQERKPEDRD